MGVNCTSPEQECNLFQPDVEVDNEDKKLPVLQHKPPFARSLRDCRLAGNNERRLGLSKASNLTPEGDGEDITFRRNGFLCAFLCPFVSCFSHVVLFCLIRNAPKQVREARITFTGCESE